MAPCRATARAGFSLLELLIVVAIIAILAATLLPSGEASLYDQLHGAAQVVSGDLAYARSLAVTNGSTYRIEFETADNAYTLEHSGTDRSLDTLPEGPFSDPDGPSDQQIVYLGDLPRMGVEVRIAALGAMEGTTWSRVADVEFGPLGQTERSASTTVFLSAGSGSGARYVSITVSPVTGLCTIGPVTAEPPPEAITF